MSAAAWFTQPGNGKGPRGRHLMTWPMRCGLAAEWNIIQKKKEQHMNLRIMMLSSPKKPDAKIRHIVWSYIGTRQGEANQRQKELITSWPPGLVVGTMMNWDWASGRFCFFLLRGMEMLQDRIVEMAAPQWFLTKHHCPRERKWSLRYADNSPVKLSTKIYKVLAREPGLAERTQNCYSDALVSRKASRTVSSIPHEQLLYETLL